MIYLLLCLMLLAAPVQAASLIWEAQTPPPTTLTVEKGIAVTGPFSLVATIPGSSISIMLTPGQWGFYRVRNGAATSNVVQYSVDLYSAGIIDRLDILESKVAAFEIVPTPVTPVTPTYPLTTRQIDPLHIELICVGTSMRTTGSGLKRIVECIP